MEVAIEDDLEERLAAVARLKEISDTIIQLRLYEEFYPANKYMIQNLDKERKTIMSKYLKVVVSE